METNVNRVERLGRPKGSSLNKRRYPRAPLPYASTTDFGRALGRGGLSSRNVLHEGSLRPWGTSRFEHGRRAPGIDSLGTRGEDDGSSRAPQSNERRVGTGAGPKAAFLNGET